MRCCFYRPETPLAEFVDFFWMIAGGETDRQERILPSGTSELVINLHEDEIRIYDSIQPERHRRLSGAVVSGTYSGAFICDARQHRSMLGVHFRPGGAFPILGAPAGELTDAHANLEDLWGPVARSLRTRLCEAPATRRRFQLMEGELLVRIRRSPERHRAVDAALQLFGPGGTGSSTRNAAREVGLSQRRLIQLFTMYVGLTPKLLCRILRFQRARTLAEDAARSARPAIHWADIAAACGHYDQSHLIHDFQNFCGLSPSQYIRQRETARRLKDNHLPHRTRSISSNTEIARGFDNDDRSEETL